jgi:hypothetical protein
MLLPLHGGLMSVETFSPPLLPLTSETALATAMLKSKMEQAVFYGDRSDVSDGLLVMDAIDLM